VFESKYTRDYHEQMAGEMFLTWFRSVLLPASSSSDEEYNEEEGTGSISGIEHLQDSE
jgi:hypothetical protein